MCLKSPIFMPRLSSVCDLQNKGNKIRNNWRDKGGGGGQRGEGRDKNPDEGAALDLSGSSFIFPCRVNTHKNLK